jgi:hypothetical protein
MIKNFLIGILLVFSTSVFAQEIINFKDLNKARAALFFPENAKFPVPLIITQHGSSPEESLGKCSFFKLLDTCVKTDVFSVRILNEGLKNGFAVAVVDAFSDIGANKHSKNRFPDATSYAHVLRDILVNDSRINSERIFYTGFSYGGYSVLHTFRESDEKRWRAIAPVEAGCQIQPAAKKLPYSVLFVQGAESHYPPKPCLYMHEELKKHGTDSHAIVIDKVDHHFSFGPSRSGPSMSLNGCTDNHIIIEQDSLRFRDGTPAVGGRGPGSAVAKCTTNIGFGGGYPHKLNEAVSHVIEFFKKNL